MIQMTLKMNKKDMKNFFNLVLLFLISSSIVGCKKDLIEEPQVDETPVFKVEGDIGGEAFSATAGDHGFLMNTFIQKVNGVDFFAGSISNGEMEFEMGFFNGNIDMAQSTFSNEVLDQLGFAYQPQITLITISKDDFPNHALINSINWSVNGELVALNTLTIDQPGKYNVGAKVNFYDGTSATIENELIVGYQRNSKGQLRHFLGQNGNLQAWIEENTNDVEHVEWYLDDVLVSNELKLETTINDQGHKVEARVHFVNGSSRKKVIWVDGALEGRFIDDFSSFESGSSTLEWDYKTRFMFKWKGKTYSSINVNNQLSHIDIVDIQYYSMSASGKPIYKLLATIECKVKELSSYEVKNVSVTTTFALEMK